ncbi:MAG TPA: glycosyltransferase family 39 protein [Thermoanaerobaculia bacterium]|nr:glycosyltransferase family 39 protein [Thermoanaerobaculia bacterium]
MWSSRALAACLIVGCSLPVALYVLRTDAGIEYDDAVYLTRGLYHAAQVSERGNLLLPRLAWSLGFEAPKPPLFHAVIAVAVLALGRGHLGAVLVVATVGPLLALALAIYALARETASPRAGWLALATYLAMPAALVLGTRLLTETTLAATVVGGTFFFLRRARGGGFRDELGAGICCGLSLLAKLLGPLFLAPVGALAVLECWRREGPRRAGRVLAVVAGVTLLLAGPWYLRNARAALDFARYAHTHLPNLYAGPARMRPIDLVRGSVGWVVLMLLFVLLFLRLRETEGGGQRLLRRMILGSAGLSALVIGAQPMFDPRYWLPAAALLATWAGIALDAAWRRLAGRPLRWLIPVASAALLVVSVYSLAASRRPQTPWTAFRAVELLAMTPPGQPRLCTLGSNPDWNIEKLRLAVELAAVRPRLKVDDLLVDGKARDLPSRLAGCDVVIALQPDRVPSVRNQQAVNADLAAGWAELRARRDAFEPAPTVAAALGSRALPQVFVRRAGA